MNAPSGEQFAISVGDSRAVITEVGGALRALELGGANVLLSYEESEMCRDGRGQILAPWPNRLQDGTYRFNGRHGAASINEIERSTAIHGLVRWQPFVSRRHDETSVVLETLLVPQPAYPWRLVLEVEYTIRETSLMVRYSARNESDDAAPFGIGFHPYFLAENGADEMAVKLGARSHLLADGRGLPIGREPFAAAAWAGTLGGDVALGATRLDDCFTDLVREDDGSSVTRFLPRFGGTRELALRVDGTFRYLMVYTADQLGSDARRAVAIEPMTCPPNALRSGEDLIVIEPGTSVSGSWSIEQLSA